MDFLSRAIGWWTPNCFLFGLWWSLHPSSGPWMERIWLCLFLPGSGESGCVVFFFFFELRRDYMSLSSIGMVLAVEVGLRDGMDSMSVFIIHPS